MEATRLGICSMIVGLAALVVGSASAQDTARPEAVGRQLGREVIRIVADETGLTPEEVLAQLREDMTLADIITANGGDVDTVIGTVVETATERINKAVADGALSQERADRMLANLEDVVTRGINGELLPARDVLHPLVRARNAAARNLTDAVADTTGLEAHEILQQARQGSTLAEVIQAHGGSVEAVVADALANATERVNALVEAEKLTREQADELLASLEEIYTDIVNGHLPAGLDRPGRVQVMTARAVLRAAAKQTGLEVSAIVEQLQAGSTLSDILAANGVDVQAFVDGLLTRADARLDQAVANGRISQARADSMLAAFRERLMERLNTPLETQGA